MKTCNSCKISKPLSEFGKNRQNPDGLMYQCKLCNRARVNEYHRLHPQVDNPERRYTRKGMTLAEFRIKLEAQGGTCAICPATADLVIDHDHSCCRGQNSCGSCYRGILCQPCNRGLGQFRDNLALLQRAVLYLGSQAGPN